MARYQLELSSTLDEMLTELMQRCDLGSKKDVVENGVMLLGWAVREVQNGLAIAAVDEARKVYREIETPALAGARRAAERERRTAEARDSEPATAKAHTGRRAA